jgi:hypothetical protein
MKTWVFLEGGYFDKSLYGVIDEENLPNEILMHHYENPQAIVAGVTILGITKKQEGDVTVVEKYAKPPTPPTPGYNRQVLKYSYAGLVDPAKVRKTMLNVEHNEYVLEEISDEAE